MKTLFARSLAFVLGMGMFAGCTARHEDDNAETGETPAKATDTIAKGRTQMDASQASLNDLFLHPQSNLRSKFAVFVTATDTLGATIRQLARQNQLRKNQAGGYFDEWDREIAASEKGEARNRAEARRTAAAARFDAVTQRYDETGNDLLAYLSDLQDLEKILSGNLTSGQLASMQAKVAKSAADAAPARTALARLSAAVGTGANLLGR